MIIRMKLIVNEEELKWIYERLAAEIVERNRGLENCALVGIRTRGVYIADKLKKLFKEKYGIEILRGILDITLYRDDLSISTHYPELKETEIDFSVDDKNIILVDDVLYTGRTVRAALDAIMDLGRPKTIQLCVLVDRGHRELPIQPDYVGKKIQTSKKERIHVKVKEYDGKDEIYISSQVKVKDVKK